MIKLKELVSYTDNLMQVGQFQDYCPNGLQIEGKADVSTIVSGVTACQDLVDAAIDAKADVLLVHHGYFWKGEDPCITGIKRQRIQRLLAAGVSLLAYHLPLDAHPELGNNAQLGRLLGFRTNATFGTGSGPDIGLHGQCSSPMRPAALCKHIYQQLGREPLHIAGDTTRETISSIAWCTGAAQSYIESAAALGVDAFLTGEISEQTVHIARETGIHFFAAGHHATERYGVQALGECLAQHFGLSHRFVDIDNPV